MKYKTILADPPWQYDNKKMLGTWNADGGAEQHYDTMSVEEIKNMRGFIDNLSEKDCVLFFWVTIPLLFEGLECFQSWGFKYKTSIVWIKTNVLPMEYWFRNYFEMCLVGIKGNIKAFRKNVPNVIFAKPIKHSRKPEKFFQMMDPIIPRPAIELFAREKRDGWDSWGDEIS